MNKSLRLIMITLFIIGLYGFLISAKVAADNIVRPMTMGGLLPDMSMHLEPNALLKIRIWSFLGIAVGAFGWACLFFLWKQQQKRLKEIQPWLIAGVVGLLLMYALLPVWGTGPSDYATLILCSWLLIKVARNKPASAS